MRPPLVLRPLLIITYCKIKFSFTLESISIVMAYFLYTVTKLMLMTKDLNLYLLSTRIPNAIDILITLMFSSFSFYNEVIKGPLLLYRPLSFL